MPQSRAAVRCSGGTSTASYDDVRWTVFVALLAGGALAQLFAAQTPGEPGLPHRARVLGRGRAGVAPELVVVCRVLQHVPEWLRQRYPWFIQASTSRTSC
jgi:hypothetical protein